MKPQDTKYNFTPIEEDLILSFAKSVNIDRLHKISPLSFLGSCYILNAGPTEIEITLTSDDRQIMVVAKNVTEDSHFFRDEIQKPPELKDILKELEQKIKG